MIMSPDPSTGFNPGSPTRGLMSRRAALAAMPGLLWPFMSQAYVDPNLKAPFKDPNYSGWLKIDDERWKKLGELEKGKKDPKTGKKIDSRPETVAKKELPKFYYLMDLRRKTWFLEYVENEYTDPQHIDCPRTVKILDDDVRKVQITGKDSKNGKEWTVFATTANGENMLVDFTPKGGPKDVEAKWTGNGWTFPDGNRWTVSSLYKELITYGLDAKYNAGGDKYVEKKLKEEAEAKAKEDAR